MKQYKYVMVQFACGHSREWERAKKPQPLQDAWCLRCHKTVDIALVLEEYRVRCYGCRYSRPFGMARKNAEIKGAQHHNKHPDHEVKILYGDKPVHVYPIQSEQIFTKILPAGAPSELEKPPF